MSNWVQSSIGNLVFDALQPFLKLFYQDVSESLLFISLDKGLALSISGIISLNSGKFFIISFPPRVFSVLSSEMAVSHIMYLLHTFEYLLKFSLIFSVVCVWIDFPDSVSQITASFLILAIPSFSPYTGFFTFGNHIFNLPHFSVVLWFLFFFPELLLLPV